MSPSHRPAESDRAPAPPQVAYWQLRTRRLPLSGRPVLMGIVNVTPDSFSDGGRFLATAAAVEHGLRLVEEGAGIIDIGGESTRPYSAPVDTDEELRRVIPVVEQLAARTSTPISIDTTKSAVARAAIDVGAEIINDISGLEGDGEMLPLAVETRAGICVMHMRGTPRTMQDDPTYENVVDEIHAYLRMRRDTLLAAGIDRDRICLDPGIGFGKTHEHNITLMANCGRFQDLGCPILVGHSRKGFLGKLIGNKEADRTNATVGAALALARQGVQVIRVHNVHEVHEALIAFEACGGLAFL